MTNAALKEAFQLQRELDGIVNQPHISKEMRKRADILMSKIASLRDTGRSTDEMNRALAAEYGKEIVSDFHAEENRQAHEDLFRRFLNGEPDSELEREVRTLGQPMIAGTQSILYTAGTNGGFLVPTKFYEAAAEGLALTDPLLNAEIVTLIQEPDFNLRPLSLPGWDLSSVAAVKVSETGTYTSANAPSITSKMLNGYTYRFSLDASLEFDEDEKAYGSAMAAMGRACGIALARGMGQDLVAGNGSTAPAGILTGAADSGVTTANAGKIVLEDFTSVFYTVNPVYRNSPKAAWLVSDSVHKMIANTKDNNNRPLFPVVAGVTYVLGKPVYIAPSLPTYNPSLGTQAAGTFTVFGDLGHFYTHVSSIRMQRQMQVPGLIENGKVRYIATQRVDSILHDPTDGALPPVVSARLHS